MRRLLVLVIALSVISGPVFCQEKQKAVTRAEIIEKLSATDFLKRKIGDLLNWGVGYDITKINRTNLAPTISFIKASPVAVPPDNRTVMQLTAKVSDPSGLDNVRGVRADLSSIQKLPNMMLVDNGLWGDTSAGDGIYTLQTSVGYDVTRGTKDIPVAVSNKMGWVALGRAKVEVEVNPVIVEANAIPQTVSSSGRSSVLFMAKVTNPGRQEDLKEVTIDLAGVGITNNIKMWDDGTHGDAKAGDTVFSVQVDLSPGISRGVKKLPVHASNAFGGKTNGEITITVQ